RSPTADPREGGGGHAGRRPRGRSGVARAAPGAGRRARLPGPEVPRPPSAVLPRGQDDRGSGPAARLPTRHSAVATGAGAGPATTAAGAAWRGPLGGVDGWRAGGEGGPSGSAGGAGAWGNPNRGTGRGEANRGPRHARDP